MTRIHWPVPAAFATHKRLNRSLLLGGLCFYTVLCLVFYYLSEVPLKPGDGIHHYQLAHFAFQTPANFLDHWGKPLFTIFSAPFAQAGLVGMLLFNLLLFALSSWCLYRIGRKFQWPLVGLAPFILMSASVYFQMVYSGMTEILMAALTVIGLLLVAIKRSAWAAVIISLSIVARPESIVIIPAFALLLLSLNQWKKIPLLATGLVLFSLLGYWGFDKSLSWVFFENTYAAESPYGHGAFNTYLKRSDLIFGYFLIPALVGATLLMVIRFRQIYHQHSGKLLIFAVFTTLAILTLHSLLWWKGLMGSAGLIRVMATIIPLTTYAALYLMNYLLKITHRKIILTSTITSLLAFACLHGVVKSKLPVESKPEYALVEQAAQWYSRQNHQGRIAYLDPYFAYRAGLNPKNQERVIMLWHLNKEDPTQSLTDGDLIMWDSHYGPLEGDISESAINQNPHLEILKYLEISGHHARNSEKPYRIYLAKVHK